MPLCDPPSLFDLRGASLLEAVIAAAERKTEGVGKDAADPPHVVMKEVKRQCLRSASLGVELHPEACKKWTCRGFVPVTELRVSIYLANPV